MSRLFSALAVCVCLCAQTGTKRSLSHRDYDKWRSIQRVTVSDDGRYLAYGLFPQEGDGDLVVVDLKTGAERRETAGALPPPPDTPPDREPGEEPPVMGIRIAFTNDNRFVVFSTFASKAEADAARKAKKEPPKGGVAVLDLASKEVAYRVPGVKNFQIPDKGPSLLAYLKEPAAQPPAADAAKPDAAARPQATPPKPPSSSRSRRPEFGTELVLRDLAKQADRPFGDVMEYSLTKDGKTLLYAVSSRKAESNGIYAVTTEAAGDPSPLVSGKGKYQKLTWDLKQAKLAFLANREEAGNRLYLWARGASAEEVVSTATPGFRSGYVISDRGQIGFSRDGSRLFFGAGPKMPEEKDDAATADAVVADLWHYKDAFIQPMQKVRAAQERNRSYRAVYHIADRKLVQLADDSLATVNMSDDGRHAIGTDDRRYRSMVDYDQIYTDHYLIDTTTGARKQLFEKQGSAQVYWSPNGEYALFHRERNWYTVEAATGKLTNLTANLPVKFVDEEEDRPQEPSPYGTSGWTRDSKWILVNDRYDVWQISPDARTARNLTDGMGRKQKLQFRIVRIERDDEDEPRGFDPSKPLLLRAEDTETRDSGFFRDRVDAEAAPVKLVMGPRAYRPVTKAKEADLLVFTASTFNEYPDLQVTDSSFRSPKKISNANPQKAGFLWGTSELISFRNADGVPLKAALYKPENFDPGRKYPMLVYIYERLSQNVHNFVEPRPGTSPNIAYYVSNGYLVLTPDIVYTVGAPGQSALKCVLPAVDAAVQRGGVNENAIGIAGHSWGGYQAAYLVTQTKRFAAVEAGAPVGNMTSAYNGIRWGSGLPRQFQYERAQSRIGGSLWDSPLHFFANSPVFHVRNIQTPVLILHNDQDDAVPWYQGIELYLSMRRNNKEAYLFNYNGEKHGIRKRPNQKDWTVRVQQFFDHHLKDGPKPEWMEKGIPYIDRDRAFAASDR